MYLYAKIKLFYIVKLGIHIKRNFHTIKRSVGAPAPYCKLKYTCMTQNSHTHNLTSQWVINILYENDP